MQQKYGKMLNKYYPRPYLQALGKVLDVASV